MRSNRLVKNSKGKMQKKRKREANDIKEEIELKEKTLDERTKPKSEQRKDR